MRILLAGRLPPGAPRGEARYLTRLTELLEPDHDFAVVVGTAAAGGFGGHLRSRMGLDLAVRRKAGSWRPDRLLAFAPEVPAGLTRTIGIQGPLPPSPSGASGFGRLRGKLRAARNQGRDASWAPTRLAADRHGGGAHVFHPGPGPVFLGSARASEPRDGPLKIVQLGTVRADKGVHLTVEAVQSLTRERERVELHLVGRVDPAYRARIERRAKGLNLTWHERPMPREHLAELLAGAHVSVLPATADGTWGFGLVESMATGLPIVHSNIGDHVDLVREAGVEVQAGDVKQVGTALRKLLRDRVHWRDRAEAGRARAEEMFGDESAIRAHLARLLGD